MEKIIAVLAILVIQILISIVVIMQWGWGLEINNGWHLIWGYTLTIILSTITSIISRE